MTTTAEQFPALQALLSHQSLIRAAQSSVKNLTEAIQVQENQSQKLREQDKAIAALKTQREDLLADIATGQDKTAELQALDTKLAQQNEATAQITQSAIVQTVAGLRRKLDGVQKELAELESVRVHLKIKALREQAEVIGGDYADASQKLMSLYDQLKALDSLLRSCSAPGEGAGSHGAIFVQPIITKNTLEIPAFSLDSVKPYIQQNGHDLLTHSSGIWDNKRSQENLHQEHQRLLALGVEI